MKIFIKYKKQFLYLGTIAIGLVALSSAIIIILRKQGNHVDNYKVELTVDSNTEVNDNNITDNYDLDFIAYNSNFNTTFKIISYENTNNHIDNKPIVKNILFTYRQDISGLFLSDVKNYSSKQANDYFIIANAEKTNESVIANWSNKKAFVYWWETYFWSDNIKIKNHLIPSNIKPLSTSFSEKQLQSNKINHFAVKLRKTSLGK